ncbi:MAG TPA: histidine phosphatase family protein [Gaiellaceae bacterium]|nr:histidine phosphatase family protein [Gaiellaceae bacterium]
MRILLVRHCDAAPGSPDELRTLTPVGHESARALGERLAQAAPAAVLCSPLVRARQTAEAIAAACGLAAEADDRLGPGTDAEAIRTVAAGKGEPVVVVGHQPDCGEIVLAATGRETAFPPGGVAEVDL